MFQLRRFAIIILAVSCIAVAAEAKADLVSGPFTTTTPIPYTPTDWIGSLTFPKFDSSLGMLTSVTLDIGGGLRTTVTVTNTDDVLGSHGTAKTEVQLTVQDSGYNLTGPELDLISSSFGYNLGVLQTATSGLLTKTGNDGGTTYLTAAVLDEFNGPGTIVLPASSFTQTLLANTGGNTNESQVTDAYLTGTVMYTYAPIAAPEPSTIALLGVAALTLLGCVRRRDRS